MLVLKAPDHLGRIYHKKQQNSTLNALYNYKKRKTALLQYDSIFKLTNQWKE